MADTGYVLNQGRVFLAERARDGAVLGFDHIGDADLVELSVSQKTDVIKNLFTGRGETVAAPVIETSCSLRIQALDMRLKNWAAATWGDFTGAAASGHVSSEAVTLYNGQHTKLARMGVSNVVVSGAVLGTDYAIDSAAHGILRALSTSTVIPAGTPFTTTVAYDYAASAGRVEALVYKQKFYQVLVAGINVAQGNKPTLLRVRQLQLQAAKSFDFVARKHMAFELSGDLLRDNALPVASTAGDFSNYFSFEKAL